MLGNFSRKPFTKLAIKKPTIFCAAFGKQFWRTISGMRARDLHHAAVVLCAAAIYTPNNSRLRLL